MRVVAAAAATAAAVAVSAKCVISALNIFSYTLYELSWEGHEELVKLFQLCLKKIKTTLKVNILKNGVSRKRDGHICDR